MRTALDARLLGNHLQSGDVAQRLRRALEAAFDRVLQPIGEAAVMIETDATARVWRPSYQCSAVSGAMSKASRSRTRYSAIRPLSTLTRFSTTSMPGDAGERPVGAREHRARGILEAIGRTTRSAH